MTLKHDELLVKIVLFDYATLAMVPLEMFVEGLPGFATDSPKIDYAAVERDWGCRSTKPVQSMKEPPISASLTVKDPSRCDDEMIKDSSRSDHDQPAGGVGRDLSVVL